LENEPEDNDDDRVQEESTKYLILDFLVDGVVDEVLEGVDWSVVNVLAKLFHTFDWADDVTDDFWDDLSFTDKFVSDNLADDGVDNAVLDGNALSGQNLNVGDDFGDWGDGLSVQDKVTVDFLQDVSDFNVGESLLLAVDSTTFNGVEKTVELLSLSLSTENFIDDVVGGDTSSEVRAEDVKDGAFLVDWTDGVNNWADGVVERIDWTDGVEDGYNWTDGINDGIDLTVLLSQNLDLWVDVLVEENWVSEVLLEFWVDVQLLEEWRDNVTLEDR